MAAKEREGIDGLEQQPARECRALWYFLHHDRWFSIPQCTARSLRLSLQRCSAYEWHNCWPILTTIRTCDPQIHVLHQFNDHSGHNTGSLSFRPCIFTILSTSNQYSCTQRALSVTQTQWLWIPGLDIVGTFHQWYQIVGPRPVLVRPLGHTHLISASMERPYPFISFHVYLPPPPYNMLQNMSTCWVRLRRVVRKKEFQTASRRVHLLLRSISIKVYQYISNFIYCYLP